MNDTAKKVFLVVVILAAVAFAIFEGLNAATADQPVKGKEYGHGTPGKGMKAAEREEEQKAGAQAGKGTADPLAGPDASQGAGGNAEPAGKDR